MAKQKEIPILSFEKWLLTGRGKSVLKSFMTVTGQNLEFAKNCLWWSFYAGQQSGSIFVKTEIEILVDDVVNLKSYLPKSIRSRAIDILKNKEEYKLQNL